ncbi:CoA pyrophosphatase [Citreimonas salinaria]|uniref:8-oxo-dGTP pyrophosphatase MutT, NUDIX family n=1 Tax=Citreimonas salinaria TaxID=321339 RepID=A0A1H3FD94_9RHOB|nr:CoA pyrophosphatase [Citreimonas salinaria]SDX88338.1 8-oxo-dGTP pyrophosphatase MutT, NUDIX family [Citreimonas salinaria]
MGKAEQIAALRAVAGADDPASSDFDLNPDAVLPPGRTLRPAGVLVAFVERGDGLALVLTKRSSRLKHHPGQIAFPGGKQDEIDADAIDAALREAHEEVGLVPETVEVLGTMPTHETVTGFLMTPVLGLIRGPFNPVPEPGEVDEIFTVPFEHVTDPARYWQQARRWRGTRRHYYTAPFGPYYIWGATARILRGLADRVNP